VSKHEKGRQARAWRRYVIRHIFEGVAALAARDAERVLRFVAEADDLGDDHPFTPRVLEALGELVPADEVAYCEMDRVRQRLGYFATRPDDQADESDVHVSYWDIAHEHPVCSAHNTGDFSALKLSDFVTLRELRNSRVYALWFGPYGFERELNVAIPSPPWHTKTFLFDRWKGERDFTERDRAVLDILQAHLGRLWRAGETRRRLQAAMDCLDSASEQDTRGFVLLRSDGRIDFASPPARRLVRDYAGATRGGALPAALAQWLESGSQKLTLQAGARRLSVRRSGSALLLEEMRDSLDLTPRETQILSWVARGKTNREVAETLWIAPSTVRKHLDNVYAKLGVSTRTAAVARLLGVLDEQPAG
jgi:DNA-binding CsgD family transcriptional regulator